MRVRRGGRWAAPSNMALIVVALLSATVLVYDFKLSRLHESIRAASFVSIDIPGNLWASGSPAASTSDKRALPQEKEEGREDKKTQTPKQPPPAKRSRREDECDCTSSTVTTPHEVECPRYLACPPTPDCPKPAQCEPCAERSKAAEPQQTCAYWRLPAYEMLQREHRRSKEAKGLLVLTLSGGWGNHFHNIARAFAVAVAMDRAFLFDVPEEAKEGIQASIEPNYIDWRPWSRIRGASANYKRVAIDAKDTLESMLDKTRGVEVVELGHLENNWHDLASATFDSSVVAHLTTKGFDIRDVLEPCLFDYLVRPSAGVEMAIQQHTTALRPTPSSKYVAIHIRTGKGEGTRPWFISAPSALEHLSTTVSAAVSGLGLPEDSKWFLATDDPELGLALRDQHPQQIVLSNTELSLTSGLHINNAELGFSKDGAVMTFVDWYLLARSDAVVRVGASSFSWTAAEYGQKQCTTRPAVAGGGILTAEGEQAEILVCV